MNYSSHLFFFLLVTLFSFLAVGQITLPLIPTDSCLSQQLATATYSKQVSVTTGSSSVLAGNCWNQSSAIKTFSRDTKDINLDLSASQNAVKQNRNGSPWTLTVPNESQEGLSPTMTIKDIVVSKTNIGATSEVTAPADSSASTVNAKREAAITGTPVFKGAKYRRQVSPSAEPPNSTITKSADLASRCSNNEISAVIESWTAYEVPSYMSSVLVASASTPGAQVDGALAIHNDVNAPGAKCTYTAKCDSITCSDVKDFKDGKLAVQRFLGYQAIVNFNNWLNAIMVALMDAGTINSLMDGKLVATFLTPDPEKPKTTFAQLIGVLTPILIIVSVILTPENPIAAGNVVAAASFLNFFAAASTAANLKAVGDKPFSDFDSVTDFIATFLKTTVVGIERVYNSTIGDGATADSWAGSDTALFTSGSWVDPDQTQDLGTHLFGKFVRVLTSKVINFALRDSGNFIIYVPYRVPLMGLDGELLESGVDQDYCQTRLADVVDLGALTICDAPGGMARIINAGAIKKALDPSLTSLTKGRPQGWDVPFDILPNEPFSIAHAIRGSVASWKIGDFDYDVSRPFLSAFTTDGTGLTPDMAEKLAQISFDQEMAGMFNVPVCQTYDLRFFPPASGKPFTTSCKEGSFGGTPNSKNKFVDHVGDAVRDVIYYPAHQFFNIVPYPLYPPPYGPSISSPNAAGYSPGICQVVIVQWQKWEGPGVDTNTYRWQVRILDGQQMTISKNFKEYHNAPTGKWLDFSSLLPSPLRIMAGPIDEVPPTFSYPNNRDWLGNDMSHECTWNENDYWGGRIWFDCRFICD